jgi:hypothetical protein
MKRKADKEDGLGKVVRGLAISVLVLLAAAAMMQHASTLPSAQASAPVVTRTEAPAHAPEAELRPIAASVAAPEAQSASLEIRDAESDGGYWYWMEHQRAMP